MGPDVKTTTIGDCNVSYEERGEGEPVMLAHGFGMNRRAMAPLAERLAPRFRVVSFDLRGHGATRCPADDSAYSYPLLFQDWVGLMDHLSIGRAHLAGHSMGGQIALMMAIERPERVRSLVAVGAGPCRRVTDPDEEATWRRGAKFFENADPDQLTAALAVSSPLAQPVENNLDLDALYGDARGADLARMIRGAYLNVESNDALCKDVTTPTLVIAGAEDGQWKEPSKKLAKLIPAGRFVEVPGAGHLVRLEKPGVVGREIEAFFADTTEGTAAS